MKLLYTGNSPYARRARVALRLGGLLERTEEMDIAPREENLQLLLSHGPAGKVPVLVTDAGVSLCESLLIGRYLDDLSGGRLLPAASAAREQALQVDSVASALMDSLFVRSREQRRPASEQSQDVITLEAERAARLYDGLAGLVAGLDGPHLGTITTVCSLGYADWRQPADAWRDGREALASWYARVSAEPAFSDTAPVY